MHICYFYRRMALQQQKRQNSLAHPVEGMMTLVIIFFFYAPTKTGRINVFLCASAVGKKIAKWWINHVDWQNEINRSVGWPFVRSFHCLKRSMLSVSFDEHSQQRETDAVWAECLMRSKEEERKKGFNGAVCECVCSCTCFRYHRDIQVNTIPFSLKNE